MNRDFEMGRDAQTTAGDRRTSLFALPHRGRVKRSWCAGALAWVFAVVCTGVVASAAMTYPDQAGDNVNYTSMQEGSVTDDLPLYGKPRTSVDSLIFEGLTTFAAYAGPGIPLDLTDGAFSFFIEANDDHTIDAISITETGDYRLRGTGPASMAGVEADFAFTVTILEVDHQPITPLPLSQVDGLFSDILPPNEPLTGWTGSATFDFVEALAGENIAGGVTKARVAFDNSLLAWADSSALAHIAKKGVTITPTVTHIPEPMGAALVALGAVMLTVRRREWSI